MPCDIVKNERKRKWQYDDTANAPCYCQLGFKLDGTMARQWWVEWSQPQTHSKWAWLDSGFVLTENTLPGQLGCSFFYLDVSEVQAIELQFVGSNEVGEDPDGMPFTVRAELAITNFDVFPDVKLDVEISVAYFYAPRNNQRWVFGTWQMILPFLGGTPDVEGTAVVFPLRRCHECTNPP